MDREVRYIIRMMLALLVFGMGVHVFNTVTATPTHSITVGEELGLTSEDFIYNAESEDMEVESRNKKDEPEVIDNPYSPEMSMLIEEYGEDFINLLAKVTEAEAGNQDLLGRQLVIDVILNRIDSPLFPNTLEDVIYQRNAFSVVSDDRINKVVISDTTLKAIELELRIRTDSDITYFSAGSYNKYCIPGYPHGDHFFGY